MVSHQMRHEAIKRQLDRVTQELDSTRDQLRAAQQELEATAQKLRVSGSSSGEPSRSPAPAQAKLAAIDHAVEQLGIESFASLEIGPTLGQFAFYTIDKPAVQKGTLVDIGTRRDFLLNAVEHAAERPGMRVLDDASSDPRTMGEIGQVDAVLLFDVLLRMVEPDWDEVLELYSPITSSFVIANPQWQGGDGTLRLIDLGRKRFLESVPPWTGHIELFDRMEEWVAPQERRYRDIVNVWQWGITDADLKGKMAELGFDLKREWSLNAPPRTRGFVNKIFVFARAGGQ
jgi:hypothetical protein